MKIFAPDYYKQFQCIASACKHSCCIGWEIEIDLDTYQKYQNVSGTFAQRFEKEIRDTDGTHCFALDEKEHCSFLNENGLCDIISEFGEGMLCDICREHPRFYTFCSDHNEVGLGLCCEEAGRLILGKSDPVQLVCVSENDESEQPKWEEEVLLLETRDRMLAIIQDRNVELSERIRHLLAFCGIVMPQKSVSEWCGVYRRLERLDPLWDETLDMWEQSDILSLPKEEDAKLICEQLLHYFIYRHFAKGFDDDRYYECVAFAIQSTLVICSIALAYRDKNGSLVLSDWVEIARQYSSEIEYSEENMQELFDVLAQNRMSDDLPVPDCRFFNMLDEESCI